MADSDKKDEKQEYKGTTAFDSAVGDGVTTGAVNAVVTGALGAGVGALIKSEERGARASRYGKWGAIAGGAIGVARGVYTGIRSAEEGEKQFKQLGDELEKTKTELAQKSTFVDMLTKEKEAAAKSSPERK